MPRANNIASSGVLVSEDGLPLNQSLTNYHEQHADPETMPLCRAGCCGRFGGRTRFNEPAADGDEKDAGQGTATTDIQPGTVCHASDAAYTAPCNIPMHRAMALQLIHAASYRR